VPWEVKRAEGFQLGYSEIIGMKGWSRFRRAATNSKSNRR
jgi:hypothetical protein